MSDSLQPAVSSAPPGDPSSVNLPSPYPGLRPFRPDENALFFGREAQIDGLAEKLTRHRFVAVVGPSGCGKSSLVQAGLLPEIEFGLLPGAEDGCRIAIMRPGARPLASLAEALVRMSGQEDQDDPSAQARKVGQLYATLRRGSRGLIEAIHQQASLPPRTGLLILVDQFEEIFRFQHAADGDEDGALVSLLLKTLHNDAASDLPFPVYVVITMRSDFIGLCNRFADLPEAINESQFLTPRLTRDERRAAIIGPAHTANGEVRSDLVNRLLNDMGDDPDQLPIMQHAMMRMWSRAATHVDAAGGRVVLTTDAYEDLGGWKRTLSNHADEAFDELTAEQQEIAETMFRCLTDPGPNANGVRRPISASAAAQVAGADLEQVKAVTACFRQLGRSFLMPPPEKPLQDDTILDISHESLIRQWDRLRKWVTSEVESADSYRRLEDKARRWEAGQEAYSQPPSLDLEMQWKQEEDPSAAWAKRYGDHYSLAMQYLGESADAWQQKLKADAEAEQEAIRKERELAEAKAKAEREAFERERERAEAKARAQAEALERAREQRDERAKVAARFQRFTYWLVAIGAVAALLAVAAAAAWLDSLKKKDLLQGALDKSKEQSEALLSASAASFIERGLHSCQRGDVDVGISWFLMADQVAPDNDDGLFARARARRLTASWGELMDYRFVVESAVSLAMCSPMANEFVTVHEDNSIRWWDAAGRKCIGNPLPLRASVTALTLDPKGQFVVVAFSDNTIQIAEPSESKPVQLEFTQPVTALAVSSDAPQVIAAGCLDGSLHLFSHDGKLISTQGSDADEDRHTDQVRLLLFRPKGERRLLSCSEDETAKLWKTGEQLQLLHDLKLDQGAVLCAAFGASGDSVATGTLNGVVQVWDVDTGEGRYEEPLVHQIGHEEPGRLVLAYRDSVRFVQFSPDEEMLLTATRQQAYLWKASRGDRQGETIDHEDQITAAAFHRSGNVILTASRDKTVCFWDALTCKPVSQALEHKQAVNAAYITGQDGTHILTACDDGTCRIWETSPRRSLVRRNVESPGELLAIAYTKDGRLSAVDQFGGLHFWGGRDRPQSDNIRMLAEHGLDIYAAASNGTCVVTLNYDSELQLWDIDSGKRLVESHTSSNANCVALSADGKRCLVGCSDGELVLYDTENWSDVARITGSHGEVQYVTISPMGDRCSAVTVDGTARIYDMTSFQEVGNVVSEEGAIGAISLGSGFGDENIDVLAAGCKDGNLVFRDMKNRDLLTEPKLHPGEITAAAFSPDMQKIAIALKNSQRESPTVFVRSVPAPGQQGQDVSAWIKENLTPEHWNRILRVNRDATRHLPGSLMPNEE